MDRQSNERRYERDYTLLTPGNSSAKPWSDVNPQPELTQEEIIAEENANHAYFLETRGFLKPDAYQNPEFPWVHPGEERDCMIGMAYSVKNTYLVSATEFPEIVDDFIKRMTSFYNERMKEWNFRGLQLHPNDVKPGIVIAINSDNEWKRAKVERLVNPRGPLYKVVTVDLGEEHRLGPKNFHYLHKDFVHQPCWAIRTLLPKMDELLNMVTKEFANERQVLEARVMRKALTQLVYDKRITTRFITQAETEQGEWVWEVELVQMEGQDENDTRGVEELALIKYIRDTAEKAKDADKTQDASPVEAVEEVKQ